MNDPIAEAAAAVEEEHGAGAPGDADPDRGAEPDAGADEMEIPESPEEINQEPTTWSARLLEPMDGDPLADHISELWDPERGGLNRLVGVTKEVAGVEENLPRAAHIPIALAELYHEHAEHFSFGGGGEEEQDDGEQITIDEGQL